MLLKSQQCELYMQADTAYFNNEEHTQSYLSV